MHKRSEIFIVDLCLILKNMMSVAREWIKNAGECYGRIQILLWGAAFEGPVKLELNFVCLIFPFDLLMSFCTHCVQRCTFCAS